MRLSNNVPTSSKHTIKIVCVSGLVGPQQILQELHQHQAPLSVGRISHWCLSYYGHCMSTEKPITKQFIIHTDFLKHIYMWYTYLSWKWRLFLLLFIALSVILWFMPSDYLFGIINPHLYFVLRWWGFFCCCFCLFVFLLLFIFYFFCLSGLGSLH